MKNTKKKKEKENQQVTIIRPIQVTCTQIIYPHTKSNIAVNDKEKQKQTKQKLEKG